MYDLLRLACFQGSSMVSHLLMLGASSWLSNIPLPAYSTIRLPIPLLADF